MSKVWRKIVAAVGVFLLAVVPMTGTAQAASNVDNSKKIEQLFDSRAQAINRNDANGIEEIDGQLASLGVEELTPDEVTQRFGSALSASQYVNKPASSNVTWMSSRQNYTYGGATYEIQTLIAQPKTDPTITSVLKKAGTNVRTIKSSAQQRGWSNLIKTTATTGVGTVPVIGSIVSIYDAVASSIAGFSTSTTIENMSATYSYLHTTTVSFKFVKKVNQSDSHQYLSFISTNGATEISYYIPRFVHSGGSVIPQGIHGTKFSKMTPNNYNSNLAAVQAYNSVTGQTASYVSKVVVTGIEGKNVITFYPACPKSIAQVY